MATNNPVFQVLATSGNQALLGVGLRPDQLKGGQLGIFNYHTGLAIDGTVASDYQDFVIAMGINRGSANNAADDVTFSAGQMIQRRHMKAITIKGFVDEAPQVTDITDFAIYCDTDYTIKVEIRNPQLYAINGYNANTKLFTYRTGCCLPSTDCDDCPAPGDCGAFVNGMIALINADADHYLTASAISSAITASVNNGANATGNATVVIGTKTYTVPVTSGDSTSAVAGKIVTAVNADTSGAYKASNSGANLTFVSGTPEAGDTGVATATVSGSGVTFNNVVKASNTPVSDTTAFATAYPGACMGIRLTGVVKNRNNVMVGSIPANYYGGGMAFVASLPESTNGTGFGLCNGKVTQTTDPTYPEGKGVDVQYDEYVAGGWNGKPGPYRTSMLTGLQKTTYEYFAAASSNYNQAILEYDQFSVGGWLEYFNNLQTIIAVPTTDTATWTSLFTVLDAIYNNTAFMSNSDDASTVLTQPVVHKINDYTKDGITTIG